MGHRRPRCESPVSDRELRTRLAAMWHGEQCLLLEVKQTLDRMSGMSAFDPKRTLIGTRQRTFRHAGMPFLRPISDRYFEDYIEGDVHCFGTVAVEADEIVAFANRFDPQSLHT